MRIEIVFAGIGGQGIRLMGDILGKAIVERLNMYSSVITRYTPAVRGGPIHVEVVISDEPIDYIRVVDPSFIIMLHEKPYLEDQEVAEAVEEIMKSMRSLIISDSRLAVKGPGVHVDLSGEAEKIGARINMVALGIAIALLKHKFKVPIEIEDVVRSMKALGKYTENNVKGVKHGYELALHTVLKEFP